MGKTPIVDIVHKLIDQIESSPSQQSVVCHTPSVWLYRLKHNPDEFYRTDDGELLWLGYKIVVVGDDWEFQLRTRNIN